MKAQRPQQSLDPPAWLTPPAFVSQHVRGSNESQAGQSPAQSRSLNSPVVAAEFYIRPQRRRGSAAMVPSERHEVISVVGGKLLLDYHCLQRHRESHLYFASLRRTGETKR